LAHEIRVHVPPEGIVSLAERSVRKVSHNGQIVFMCLRKTTTKDKRYFDTILFRLEMSSSTDISRYFPV